jgi:hypothetical protein
MYFSISFTFQIYSTGKLGDILSTVQDQVRKQENCRSNAAGAELLQNMKIRK